MKNKKSIIREISTVEIKKADWNYKEDIEKSEEKKRKFIKSIQRDGPGVPAVRKIGDSVWEIIDGNHRLDALVELGYKKLVIEDFGEITIAEAISLARRRNTVWFEDDLIKLTELYRDYFIKDENSGELLDCMLESREDIEQMISGLSFDWDAEIDQDSEGEQGEDGVSDKRNDTKDAIFMTIALPEEVYRVLSREIPEIYQIRNLVLSLVLDHVKKHYQKD
jgi:hypothetical protein